MCVNTGTPKKFNFSFETNGKLMTLGVPILKHFRVLMKERICSYRSNGFPLGLELTPIEEASMTKTELLPLKVYPSPYMFRVIIAKSMLFCCLMSTVNSYGHVGTVS